MPEVHFSSAIRRQIACRTEQVSGQTVREALGEVFESHQALESYLFDDQGVLRHHVAIFVDGAQIEDRRRESDPVGEHSRIDVMQALSGG